MEKRKIGNSGLKLFPIGLGAMACRSFMEKTMKKLQFITLQAALDKRNK